MEQSRTEVVREMLASGRIIRVYLDELGAVSELPIGLGLMVLTTLGGDEAISEARGFIDRSQGNRGIIDAVSTIMVYKFSNLSRDEVDAILGIELEQTRVYQEAKAEGRNEGEQALVLKLLTRKLGSIDPQLRSRIINLNIDRVESLGEALLDFTSIADLEAWLSHN
jgi:predicted transposase YdaD